ncbi:Tf2-6, partial [Mucuna pruriens]
MFESFTLIHVPRDQNERADLLAKLASTQRRGQQKSVIHENLSAPTVDRLEVWSLESKTTWMTPFLEYLREDQVPKDPGEAQRVIKEASKYTLVGQHLYRRGYAFPLLRCLEGDEATYIIQEVHEGRFAEGHKAPQERLHSVTSPWPFYKWGVDILGPFPPALGQVEAEPVATISSERIKRFFWKKIICRFDIPVEIVSDNGTQFASKGTVEFYEGIKIKQLFTWIEHSQSNNQAEATNKVILRGLQRQLEEAKGRWVDDLPQVLWSYHTTPHSTTNETPFRLTFGT